MGLRKTYVNVSQIDMSKGRKKTEHQAYLPVKAKIAWSKPSWPKDSENSTPQFHEVRKTDKLKINTKAPACFRLRPTFSTLQILSEKSKMKRTLTAVYVERLRAA